MPFEALTVSLQLAGSLRDPLDRIRRHDASLSLQIRRAAASVPLNLAEGRQRAGQDRRHHWRIAAGSTAIRAHRLRMKDVVGLFRHRWTCSWDEVRAALCVAEAFGYVDAAQIRGPLELLDRVVAMTWRLTH